MELAPKNFQDYKLLHSTLFVCIPRDLKPGSDIKKCILDATSSGMALSGSFSCRDLMARCVSDRRRFVLESSVS